MTYIIRSAKAKTSMTTKDPLKDAQWGNAYYGVDDCVVEEVVEKTQSEMDAIEVEMSIKAHLAQNDIKAIRSILEGNTVKMAEWKTIQDNLRAKLPKAK